MYKRQPRATATPEASESPEATATPEATPSITLAPLPSATAEEPAMVWVAGDNLYYHANYDCEGLSGAHQISLSDAVAQGYLACNRCNPPELSMEEMLALLPEEQAGQLRATLTSAAPEETATPEPTEQPTPEATAQAQDVYKRQGSYWKGKVSGVTFSSSKAGVAQAG